MWCSVTLFPQLQHCLSAARHWPQGWMPASISRIMHSQIRQSPSQPRFLYRCHRLCNRSFRRCTFTCPLAVACCRYKKGDRHNRLLQILGGTTPAPEWPNTHRPSTIKINADANVCVSESDPGVSYEVALGAERQAYLVCIEGEWRTAHMDQGCNVNDVCTHVLGGSRRGPQVVTS